MRLLFLLGVVAAVDHLMSFNAQCTATFEMLAGTPAQMGFTGGRIPFQFLNAMQRVLQARVENVTGCGNLGAGDGAAWPRTSAYSKLFGLDVINLIRFMDASDSTALNSALWPGGCTNTSFDFNWADIKRIIKGIQLPSTCKADKFYPNGCHFIFRIIDNLDIQISIKDTCTNPKQTGWRLPQFEVRCSGSYCNQLGKPCVPGDDCGGLTCDPIDLYLNDTNPLTDMGLYNATFDAGCDSGGFTFAEKFWSQVVNNVANLVGYTTTVDKTKKWKQVSLCGVQAVSRRFKPSQAPTPVARFICSNGTQIDPFQVCDGIPDCGSSIPTASDEGFGSDCCGVGRLRTYDGFCCPVCGDTDNGCSGSFLRGGQQCNVDERSDDFPDFCVPDANGVLVCDNLFPLTPPANPPASIPFKSVTSTSQDEHIGLWFDCLGNVQFGNVDDIAVFNGFGPFHQVAARLEDILKETQGCRDQSVITNDYLRKQFFAWGITWFGGMFMDTLSATQSFHGITPGALFDNSARWYHSADERNGTNGEGHYLRNPPFANLEPGPWTTCNLATLTGASHSCQINANLSSWFRGAGFPPSWSTLPTTVQLRVASDCAVDLGQNYNGDALPNIFVQCKGACTVGPPNAQDSGCCLMRKPFVVVSPLQTCPPGYFRSTISSDVTDFVFPSNSTPQSHDSTLINFLQLLSARKSDFDASLPFFDVFSSVQGLCIINMSSFGDSVDQWARDTYTESCPIPFVAPGNGSVGCPQILTGGGVQGCGGAGLPCATPPQAAPCVNGCPLPPENCVGAVCASGSWLAPSLSLGLIATMFAQ